MTLRHKVGRMTDFGLLVAESVKWDMPTQSVALYEIDGESPYMVIIWDITEESAEFEISRTYHDTDEQSIAFLLDQAFGVSL